MCIFHINIRERSDYDSLRTLPSKGRFVRYLLHNGLSRCTISIKTGDAGEFSFTTQASGVSRIELTKYGLKSTVQNTKSSLSLPTGAKPAFKQRDCELVPYLYRYNFY